MRPQPAAHYAPLGPAAPHRILGYRRADPAVRQGTRLVTPAAGRHAIARLPGDE